VKAWRLRSNDRDYDNSVRSPAARLSRRRPSPKENHQIQFKINRLELDPVRMAWLRRLCRLKKRMNAKMRPCKGHKGTYALHGCDCPDGEWDIQSGGLRSAWEGQEEVQEIQLMQNVWTWGKSGSCSDYPSCMYKYLILSINDGGAAEAMRSSSRDVVG